MKKKKLFKVVYTTTKDKEKKTLGSKWHTQNFLSESREKAKAKIEYNVSYRGLTLAELQIKDMETNVYSYYKYNY